MAAARSHYTKPGRISLIVVSPVDSGRRRRGSVSCWFAFDFSSDHRINDDDDKTEATSTASIITPSARGSANFKETLLGKFALSIRLFLSTLQVKRSRIQIQCFLINDIKPADLYP